MASYVEYVDRVRRTILNEMERLEWERELDAEDIPEAAAQRVADLLGVSAALLIPTARWAAVLLSRMYIVSPSPPELELPPEGTGPRALGVTIEPPPEEQSETG
ncbi:MAG: hypothetical protein ACI8S6_004297 [Myxococcota bacterium]|jgi:hypothetical protein